MLAPASCAQRSDKPPRAVRRCGRRSVTDSPKKSSAARHVKKGPFAEQSHEASEGRRLRFSLREAFALLTVGCIVTFATVSLGTRAIAPGLAAACAGWIVKRVGYGHLTLRWAVAVGLGCISGSLVYVMTGVLRFDYSIFVGLGGILASLAFLLTPDLPSERRTTQ